MFLKKPVEKFLREISRVIHRNTLRIIPAVNYIRVQFIEIPLVVQYMVVYRRKLEKNFYRSSRLSFWTIL